MFIKNFIKKFIPREVLTLRRRIIDKKILNKNFKETLRNLELYLQNNEIRLLQLGSQSNTLNGWFNTDLIPNKERSVYYLDVTKDFPIKNNQFDYIYAEELIEHINYFQGLQMLKECARILKPGGKIRICTPNLKNFINLYKEEKTELENDYIKWIVDNFMSKIGIYKGNFVINNLFYNWEHKFIYDFEILSHSFNEAGFKNIKEYKEGESNEDVFKSADQHGLYAQNQKFRNLESFFIEARK